MANINISGPTVSKLNELRDVDTVSVAPTTNNVLLYDGSNWTPSNLPLKADLVGGLIPSSQLPSYVDDVEEYANIASFPVTGESSKLYIDLENDELYRWTGSVYVLMSDVPSAADIKTLYESNANTNEFSDAEQTKLTGIEDSATADQTGAEIKISYEAELDTNAYTDAEVSKLAAIEALAEVNDANTTLQGNTFNGISELVQLNVSGQLPAIDGSLLTGITGGASDLDGLTDVIITTPSTDQILEYNGTNWVNATAAAGGGGTDVGTVVADITIDWSIANSQVYDWATDYGTFMIMYSNFTFSDAVNMNSSGVDTGRWIKDDGTIISSAGGAQVFSPEFNYTAIPKGQLYMVTSNPGVVVMSLDVYDDTTGTDYMRLDTILTARDLETKNTGTGTFDVKVVKLA